MWDDGRGEEEEAFEMTFLGRRGGRWERRMWDSGVGGVEGKGRTVATAADTTKGTHFPYKRTDYRCKINSMRAGTYVPNPSQLISQFSSGHL